MSMDLTGLCRDHSFESASALCRRCGLEFCENCVVTPFGDKKPVCKECAMAMGGVRSHVGRAPMNPRLVRKRAKAFAANLPASASAPMPEPELPAIVDTTTEEPITEAGDPNFDLAPVGHRDPIPGTTPPPPTPGDPAAGVAPAVDWNNPFG